MLEMGQAPAQEGTQMVNGEPLAHVPEANGALVAPGGGLAQPERKVLLVIDRRPVIRGSLILWIAAFGPDFDVVSAADVRGSDPRHLPATARALIFGTGSAEPFQDAWLRGQIEAARTRYPDTPIVLLSEDHDGVSVDALARQLDLSGYIPTSSSAELAEAALRVIIAGGRYIPPSWNDTQAARPSATALAVMTDGKSLPDGDVLTRLTPRERVVLELLERGMPNKVIGDRLGMSPSTVKAHVHNIIGKFNVRNRTEAALARFAGPTRPVPAKTL
jgi:DNA-binding NarL/FixJ family response regulator